VITLGEEPSGGASANTTDGSMFGGNDLLVKAGGW
jgi:hypothetical protein